MPGAFDHTDPAMRLRNMHGLSEDAPLWRIFQLTHLEEMFRSRTNTLVKPKVWDDPFENFLGKCFGRLTNDGNKLVSLRGLYDGFYGQCWTSLPDETDALWRIYAPGSRRGARVRVRAGPLFDTVYCAHDKYRTIRCFIGPVEYLSIEHIEDLVVNEGMFHTFDPSGLGQARSLLIKRGSFEHEAEVRLLYNVGDSHEAVDDLKRFPCDPTALVEDILLDPRMTHTEAGDYIVTLRSLGYEGSAAPSDLYAPPAFPVLDIDY